MTESVGGAPLVVLWLALGAVFFTLFMRGYNLWGFRHAIEVVRGKFDNPAEPGEVTHFQALASALSATVGLGNIAGVTIAMASGGPGAFFWMVACGLLGMTSKFVECTLGQKYRQVKPDGSVLGGPMQYLHAGLKEMGLGPLGYLLSIIFAVMCILASFGGGNMFQANQSGQQVLSLVQSEDHRQLEKLDGDIKAAATANDYAALTRLQGQKNDLQRSMKQQERLFKPMFGVFLAVMVGVVIIGGIKRIGAAAEKVVPTMCVIYMAACLYIIGMHAADVPGLLLQIVSEAFTPKAFGGGMLGVLVVGVQRAAFSNEAGVGSAAIAHSAAKTEEPVREGTVALLGPFIDTVVVCTMTALVILITGAWNNEQWLVNQGLKGTTLTSRAFAEEISWFPALLTVAVVLFAYSTLISWSYYGERCWERLFGPRSTVIYKVIYVVAAFVGVLVNLGAVLDFSDMMILSMAFPNIFGLLLLSPGVRRDLTDYWRRYKANEFQTFTQGVSSPFDDSDPASSSGTAAPP
ncbi:MAG: alanine/glycine:cation symporter family protein [Planctomycetaceae bacterium]